MREESGMPEIREIPQSRYGSIESVLNRVYMEELGWLSPLEKVFDDRFREHAVWLGAFDGDEPIGTLRLVCDSPPGLPVEQFTDVRHLDIGSAWSCSVLPWSRSSAADVIRMLPTE
jgi:hypothetical protein